MNGAESLARTLVAGGVDTCFANPGTSEMHFVSALDRVAGLRCVLGLAETVVAGCADGYARMAGKPAATLFHCGPGLGNAIANLHNAKRAHTPIVNIVGDHATYHRPHDAPLTADTEGLARAVSAWHRDQRTRWVDAAAAMQAARTPPGGTATPIPPADCAWTKVRNWAPPHRSPAPQWRQRRSKPSQLRFAPGDPRCWCCQALRWTKRACVPRTGSRMPRARSYARQPRFRAWREAAVGCRWTAFPTWWTRP
jgi:thiamine pyrophosphate-dependent acetolactate synthase large subunit-like protein